MKNPLVKNFSRGLQQIEASRGMYFSPAAAADEARRLAGLGARLQMQAAPGLMGLVGWKERYRQEIFPQLAEYRVRYRTGGRYGWRGGKQAPAPINPTLAGITGAMQAGAMGLQMFGGLGGLGGVNAIGATVA